MHSETALKDTPKGETFSIKRFAIKVVPWIITVVALYIAFHDVNWQTLFTHLGDADPILLVVSLLITVISYLMRSRRWQFLFPDHVIDFGFSAKVLILGFFMNNILPARAGEFVRAHMGAKVTGTKRTLVLATIASERLTDGLMLSIFFIAFALGGRESRVSHNLLYVAGLFALIGVGVVGTLLFQKTLFALADKFKAKISSRAVHFAIDRLQIFITGLSPLTDMTRLPLIVLWTIAIWLVELSVYILITRAFNTHLGLSSCVLFLVTVNFSSLIPAAPGAIGVIEAIASSVLVTLGIPKEQALTMVLVQHVIQYLVVGIPGAIVMLTWKKQLQQLENAPQDE